MTIKNPLFMQMPFPVTEDGFAHITDAQMSGYSSKGGINFGDFFVCDATMRILNYDFTENVQFNVMGNSKQNLDRLKDTYDSIIIRGSTYLWEGYDLDGAAEFIEFMDKPVLLFGLGAQAPSFEDINLTPGTIRFIKAVSERTGLIGCRGEFTATQIRRFGVNNVEVLGCPTFMRKGGVHEIKKSDKLEKVGVTLTRQASGIFANNVSQIQQVHRQLLRSAARISTKSYLISQGEKEEYRIANKEKGAREAVNDILNHLRFEQGDKTLKAVRKLYLERTVAFPHMRDWEDFSATLDFVIGFRLHGNIVALHQGVPGVFITCDSRVQEIVDVWKLPYVKTSQIMDLDIRKLYEKADFSNFKNQYDFMHNKWVNFFKKNKAEHTLGPTKKISKKILGVDQNLSRSCIGEDLTPFLGRLEDLLLENEKYKSDNYQLRRKLVDERAARTS